MVMEGQYVHSSMADQDLNKTGLPVITYNGIVDNNPITQTRSWYKLSGCLGLSGVLERATAKRLSFKFIGESILALHSNQQGSLFIETNLRLLMIAESDLTSLEVIDDTTGQVVVDDVTGQHVIV